MTELGFRFNPDNSGETVDSHRFPVPVNRLLSCLFVVSLSACLLLPSFAYGAIEEYQNGEQPSVSENAATDAADQPEFTKDDNVDVEVDPSTMEVNGGLSLSLSDPEVWQEGDMVFYKTLLSVKNAEAFFGYQVEVEAGSEENVQVTNVFNGIKTDPVYKENNLYLASMNTTQASGDVSTCEIVAKYPLSDTSSNKQVVVRSFRAVTSINPEEIVSMGPEPAALVLSLPVPEGVGNLTPIVIIVLACFCVVMVLFFLSFLKKNTENSRRGRHGRVPMA